MMIIKNREVVVEQLTEMLVDFAKAMRNYQTDVYLYYNTEEQTAELDTFVNVGGNSWLNDDHYTIYSDKEHFESVFDSYGDEKELLAAATNYDTAKADEVFHQIMEKVAEDEDEDIENISPDDVTYTDVRDWIMNADDLYDTLCNVYADEVEDMRADYAQQAEDIISRFEEEAEI